MSQWGENGQRQVILDGLMVMTVPSQAEWMGLIEQSVFKCVRTCVCVHFRGWRRPVLQMAAVSMAAIKRWEVSGQG